MQRSRKDINRLNNARGKAFEERVVKLMQSHGIVAERIERSHYGEKAHDITLKDYPSLRVDCKYFSQDCGVTFAELGRKLATCREKYCEDGQKPVIIYGEQRTRTRVPDADIGVCMMSPLGMVIMPLIQWLLLLVESQGGTHESG